MGNVLSPYSFNLQGGYQVGTVPETYGVYEHTWADWTYGGQSGGSVTLTQSNEVKAFFPENTNAVRAWAILDISAENANEVFIEFEAKIPNYKWGCKFVKIFGQQQGSPAEYANTTVTVDGDGSFPGSMWAAIYGDGSGVSNDAANIVKFFEGTTTAENIGRSSGTASVLTPVGTKFDVTEWNTDWHKFRMHVKFNDGTTSGNEVANGEIFIEIDGNVYMNATGLFNRHHTNLPIWKVEFFGYSSGNGANEFDISMKNPIVSTVGFSS